MFTIFSKFMFKLLILNAKSVSNDGFLLLRSENCMAGRATIDEETEWKESGAWLTCNQILSSWHLQVRSQSSHGDLVSFAKNMRERCKSDFETSVFEWSVGSLMGVTRRAGQKLQHFWEINLISIWKTIQSIAINWADCNQLFLISEAAQSSNSNEKACPGITQWANLF